MKIIYAKIAWMVACVVEDNISVMNAKKDILLAIRSWGYYVKNVSILVSIA